MKKLYFLDEQEKQRILNLHTEATKKQYLGVNELLNERRQVVKGGLNFLKRIFKNDADQLDTWLARSSRRSGRFRTGTGLTKKNRLIQVLNDVLESKIGNNLDDFIHYDNNIPYLSFQNGTKLNLDKFLTKIDNDLILSNNFSKKEIEDFIDLNFHQIVSRRTERIKELEQKMKEYLANKKKTGNRKKDFAYTEMEKEFNQLLNSTPPSNIDIKADLKKAVNDEFFPRGSSQPSTSPSSGGGGSGLRFRWWPRIPFNNLSPKTQRIINNSLGVAIYGGAAATTSKGIFNLSFKAASNRKREYLSQELDKNIIQSCKSVGKPTMDEDGINYYTVEIYEAGQTMFGKFEKVFKRSIEALKTKDNFCAMIGLFNNKYNKEYQNPTYKTIFVRFMDKEFSPYWLTRSDTGDYERYVIKPIQIILGGASSTSGGSISSGGDGAPKSDSGKIEYIVPQQFKECLKNGKCTNVQEGTNKCLTTKLNNKFYFYSPNPQDQVFIEGHPAAFWSDKSYTTNSDRTEVVNNSKYFYCDGSRLVETTTPICCLDPKAKDNPDCHC